MAFLLLSEARGGGEADGSTPGGRATQLTQESEASRPHCPERSGSPKDKGTRKSPKIRNFPKFPTALSLAPPARFPPGTFAPWSFLYTLPLVGLHFFIFQGCVICVDSPLKGGTFFSYLGGCF